MKDSKTGRGVVERIKNENPPRIRTTSDVNIEFMVSNGKWYNIDKVDIACKTDVSHGETVRVDILE